MDHSHLIYDTDKHFKIDPISRVITSESEKLSLIQYDHNSERFTFEMPRIIEGHDMSLSDSIRIHYINISGNGTDKQSGIYDVHDAQISNEEDDILVFSWLISRDATKFSGTLNFSIRFNCVENEELVYSWGTGIFRGITVSSGLNNNEVVYEEYIDILEEWRNDLYSKIDEINSRINNIVSPEIPEKLPNPNSLEFTGYVVDSYDGSSPLTVEIPSSLKNPNSIIFTGSVNETYDGSEIKEVSIPEGIPEYTINDVGKKLVISDEVIPVWVNDLTQTDEHINELINIRLEQIPLAEGSEF